MSTYLMNGLQNYIYEKKSHERIIFLGLRPDYNENLVHNTYQFSPVSAQPILSQKVLQSELKIAATFRVENILKNSLDSIPSPSTSVKIQIKGRKFCLWCKGKTLLGLVNKLLKTKILLTSPRNVLPV